MTYKGRVENGVVVLEDGPSLPDGTEVNVEPVEKPVGTLGQRLMKFAGIVHGLPSDMARNHDHYLHDGPRNEVPLR